VNRAPETPIALFGGKDSHAMNGHKTGLYPSAKHPRQAQSCCEKVGAPRSAMSVPQAGLPGDEGR
jgi:hypothetical protein